MYFAPFAEVTPHGIILLIIQKFLKVFSYLLWRLATNTPWYVGHVFVSLFAEATPHAKRLKS